MHRKAFHMCSLQQGIAVHEDRLSSDVLIACNTRTTQPAPSYRFAVDYMHNTSSEVYNSVMNVMTPKRLSREHLEQNHQLHLQFSNGFQFW